MTQSTEIINETAVINGIDYPVQIGEFWTAKQRQSNGIHEVSYRACFKSELPHFFIEQYSEPDDTVYDPFAGRGTTVIEAARLGRRVIANDINPLSRILSEPRLTIPDINDIAERLDAIGTDETLRADIDLSMFYHPKTLMDILSVRAYLDTKKREVSEDAVDRWIRMVATNRLSGHSSGFFSVYTLPPNQAVSATRQVKLNQQRKQTPDERNVRKLILRKSRSLVRDIDESSRRTLYKMSQTAQFYCEPANATPSIIDNSVQLTVTSPPFLDVVQYAQDNWLRWWFNAIDSAAVERRITMARTVKDWSVVMLSVLKELYRITKPGGYVAFEVGEVQKGNIRLEEVVVPLAVSAGFGIETIIINRQQFTKTANIWGIDNNARGTNSNRIALLKKL